mmetsp:Transcript_1639/g.4540  ORF Transcript_1639/g.4540 Transcript_1639/m.4540 type:complete len:267 (-) Transcript_1639:865-1665(-)
MLGDDLQRRHLLALRLHVALGLRGLQRLGLRSSQPAAQAEEATTAEDGEKPQHREDASAAAAVDHPLHEDDREHASHVAEGLQDGADRRLPRREADLCAELAGAAPTRSRKAHDAHGQDKEATIQVEMQASEAYELGSRHEASCGQKRSTISLRACDATRLEYRTQNGRDATRYRRPRCQRRIVAVVLQQRAFDCIKGVAQRDVHDEVPVNQPEVDRPTYPDHVHDASRGRSSTRGQLPAGSDGCRRVERQRRNTTGDREEQLAAQ